MDSIQQLIRRAETLEGNRTGWLKHYEDLARVFAPRQMGFTSGQTEGGRRTGEIYDGAPMQAARGLANAIGGLLRPEGQKAFSIKAVDDDIDEMDEAKDWLAETTERLDNAIKSPRARARQALGETDFTLVVFGEAPLYVGDGLDHLVFQTSPLRNTTVTFAEDGRPDGAFIRRTFTVRQMAARFGREALSDRVRKLLDDGRVDEKVKVLHAVVPRAEGTASAMLARNLPIADIWVDLDSKTALKSGGFHEFPFVVPRWDTTSGEDHGRSPAMIALPDGDTLQAMGETILVAGQRAADPPLMAPNDGSFDAVNTFPGGLSYYDVETAAQVRGNPFFALEPGGQLPITLEMQRDRREQVFAAFFRNVLNLPTEGPQMTATEVMQRKEEFIREVGPVFGRLESDYTAPMVERCFHILLRAGAFAPIPEVLQGRDIRFEYDSPVKRVRTQVEAVAARNWAMSLLSLEAAHPEAGDLVNIDALARYTAQADGVPHDIVNSREDVERKRAARAQAQQALQQAQMVQSGAETAKTAGEAVGAAGGAQGLQDLAGLLTGDTTKPARENTAA